MSAASAYLYLGIAIMAEVVATSALKATDSFTRPVPSLVTIAFYALAFWSLSLALKVVPTGIAYGIWSGIGIVAITAVSWVWYRQSLDPPALLGLGLIIAGVVVINLFSKSVPH
jgi:small multidrug resistance pump